MSKQPLNPHGRQGQGQRAQRGQRMARLVIPSTGTRIPVPDGSFDDPAVRRAEHEALAAHPEVQERVAAQAARRAAGERGIPAAEAYRALGLPPPGTRSTPTTRAGRRTREGLPRGRKPEPAKPSGRLLLRLPVAIHQRLMEEAAVQHVSVNQLAGDFISRALDHAPADQG